MTSIRRTRAVSCLFTICMAIGLAGCVTTPTYHAIRPTEETGVVVLSLGSRGKFGVSSHALKIRAIGKTDEVLASYLEENLFTPTPRDFDKDGTNGTVVLRHLSPGSYEIFNFSTFFNGYPSTATFQSKQDFSIRFSVKKGETAYLGRFLANRATGKNLLGMTVTAGVFFDVSDQAQEDLRIAATRFSPIGQQPSVNFIGSVKSAGSQFIRVN